MLLAAISSSFLYIYRKFSPHSRPPFTTVKKNERHLLPTDERKVYDYLTNEGYYVSCRFKYGNVVIPLALIPFRYAIYPKGNLLKCLVIQFYLSMMGWKVIFIPAKNKETETTGAFDEELKKIVLMLEKVVVSNKGQGA